MRTAHAITLIPAVLILAACGAGDREGVPATADAVADQDPKSSVAASPSGPVTIDYRIIGEPVVGQPVAIELAVDSTLGSQPVDIRYGIGDASAMQLAKSQPERISLSPGVPGEAVRQQVTIVPMREGRLYLNVSARVETDAGSMSTVTAIPIQVGEGTPPKSPNGEVVTDENGERLRVVPAEER